MDEKNFRDLYYGEFRSSVWSDDDLRKYVEAKEATNSAVRSTRQSGYTEIRLIRDRLGLQVFAEMRRYLSSREGA